MAPRKKRPVRKSGNKMLKKLFRPQKRKFCFFTVEKKEPDWKDVKTLRKFISEAVKIIPSKKTGTSTKNQKLLSIAIKRARYMALLPYTVHHLRSSEE